MEGRCPNRDRDLHGRRHHQWGIHVQICFEDGPGSNPEQLIAAAHASCFSMALANLLAKAGSPPDSLHTDATVTLRPVDGTPTITKIALITVGRVPGLDQGAFAEHAKTAKEGCPVGRALAGVPEITLEATLAP
jgi:osmotically inducible protein OsmC